MLLTLFDDLVAAPPTKRVPRTAIRLAVPSKGRMAEDTLQLLKVGGALPVVALFPLSFSGPASCHLGFHQRLACHSASVYPSMSL